MYLTKYAKHVHLVVRGEKMRASMAMQARGEHHLANAPLCLTLLALLSPLNSPPPTRTSTRPHSHTPFLSPALETQDRTKANPNITIHYNAIPIDVTSDSTGQLDGLRVRDAASGAERVIAVRGVFYGIGHTPNSDIVAGQVVRSLHCSFSFSAPVSAVLPRPLCRAASRRATADAHSIRRARSLRLSPPLRAKNKSKTPL